MALPPEGRARARLHRTIPAMPVRDVRAAATYDRVAVRVAAASRRVRRPGRIGGHGFGGVSPVAERLPDVHNPAQTAAITSGAAFNLNT